MFKRRLPDPERRFWSAIGIGSGLTVFFFGVSIFSPTALVGLRGWVTILAGVIMLVAGFYLASTKKAQQPSIPGEDIKGTVAAPGAEAAEGSLSDEQYTAYLFEDRKSLVNALREQARSFDRYILTLAGGTFGLSLVFVNQIVPSPQSATIGYLVTAWASFAASILLTLVSFLFGQEACYKQIETLDKLLVKELERSKEFPFNVFGTITKSLNWLSMLMFIVGVSFLIAFAAKNL